MLVLTTMFINVSNNLPKTSYMKMIDVWLLFNLLYPFLVVLLHTYMDTLRKDEDRDEGNTENTIKVKVAIILKIYLWRPVGGKNGKIWTYVQSGPTLPTYTP